MSVCVRVCGVCVDMCVSVCEGGGGITEENKKKSFHGSKAFQMEDRKKKTIKNAERPLTNSRTKQCPNSPGVMRSKPGEFGHCFVRHAFEARRIRPLFGSPNSGEFGHV